MNDVPYNLVHIEPGFWDQRLCAAMRMTFSSQVRSNCLNNEFGSRP